MEIFSLILKIVLMALAVGGAAALGFLLFLAFEIIRSVLQLGEAWGFWSLQKGWKDGLSFLFFNWYGIIALVLNMVIFVLFGISLVTLTLTAICWSAYAPSVHKLTYPHQKPR